VKYLGKPTAKYLNLKVTIILPIWAVLRIQNQQLGYVIGYGFGIRITEAPKKGKICEIEGLVVLLMNSTLLIYSKSQFLW
jgi:hypothetical protein